MIVVINLLLCFLIQSEGFAPQTLVKTPHGYRPIASLQVNDEVICCDIKTGIQHSSPITAIKKTKHISYFVRSNISFAVIGHHQRIYIPHLQQWVPIQQLTDHIYLSQQTIIKKVLPYKSETLISLTVAEYHNFYITEDDILVHNAPVVFLATTAAAESIIPLIASSGVFTGIAAYLGIKAFRERKKKQSIDNHLPKKAQPPIHNHHCVLPCDLDNGKYISRRMCATQSNLSIRPTCPPEPQPEIVNTCPAEDDEIKQDQPPCCQDAPIIELEGDCLLEDIGDSILTMGEKLKPKGYTTPENPRSNPNKKKHGNPEERYKNNPLGRPLTDPEAREKAKEFGMQQTWDYPFDSHGRAVFTADGKIFITPDADGHKGGVWKLYHGGDRQGTYDINLETKIGT
jgi:hypothetical protein